MVLKSGLFESGKKLLGLLGCFWFFVSGVVHHPYTAQAQQQELEPLSPEVLKKIDQLKSLIQKTPELQHLDPANFPPFQSANPPDQVARDISKAISTQIPANQTIEELKTLLGPSWTAKTARLGMKVSVLNDFYAGNLQVAWKGSGLNTEDGPGILSISDFVEARILETRIAIFENSNAQFFIQKREPENSDFLIFGFSEGPSEKANFIVFDCRAFIREWTQQKTNYVQLSPQDPETKSLELEIKKKYRFSAHLLLLNDLLFFKEALKKSGITPALADFFRFKNLKLPSLPRLNSAMAAFLLTSGNSLVELRDYARNREANLQQLSNNLRAAIEMFERDIIHNPNFWSTASTSMQRLLVGLTALETLVNQKINQELIDHSASSSKSNLFKTTRAITELENSLHLPEPEPAVSAFVSVFRDLVIPGLTQPEIELVRHPSFLSSAEIYSVLELERSHLPGSFFAWDPAGAGSFVEGYNLKPSTQGQTGEFYPRPARFSTISSSDVMVREFIFLLNSLKSQNSLPLKGFNKLSQTLRDTEMSPQNVIESNTTVFEWRDSEDFWGGIRDLSLKAQLANSITSIPSVRKWINPFGEAVSKANLEYRRLHPEVKEIVPGNLAAEMYALYWNGLYPSSGLAAKEIVRLKEFYLPIENEYIYIALNSLASRQLLYRLDVNQDGNFDIEDERLAHRVSASIFIDL